MSNHAKRHCVRILNPLPGGKTYTSGRRACRYVREGRARWADETGSAIEFVASHRGHQAVSARQLVAMDEGDTWMATLDQIAGLPVINPVKLITDTNSPRTRLGRRQRGRSGPVRAA